MKKFLAILLTILVSTNFTAVAQVQPIQPATGSGRPSMSAVFEMLDFVAGDVIYIPHANSRRSQGGQAIFQSDNMVTHYQQSGGFDLLFYRSPNVWLAFRMNSQTVSLISNQTHVSPFQYPLPGMPPLEYRNVQCARYIRTHQTAPTGARYNMPHGYSSFVTNLIGNIVAMNLIPLSTGIPVGIDPFSSVQTEHHDLLAPAWSPHIHELVNVTRMRANEQSTPSDYQQAASIQDFSNRAGFRVRRVFQATTLTPPLPCGGSRRRAMYRIPYSQQQTRPASELQASVPWFFPDTTQPGTAVPIGVPISWDDVAQDILTSAQLTGLWAGIAAVMGALSAAEFATGR